MAQEESMFGPTPLAIQDQLDQQFLQRNSNLDLGSMSARAGLAMGNGINGLLGREDPRVAEAKQVQEAVAELRKSGVDMSNPEEYYKKMAGIFGAKGLTAQAEKAAMKALEYQDKAKEREFKATDRDMQLQIKSQELAIKNAQLSKEMAKAMSKEGGADLVKILKDGYSTANLDQESIAKALAEFNRDGGTLESAMTLLRNKKEKPDEKWSDPYSINVNGKVVRVQKNLATGVEKAVAGNEANITNNTRVDASMKLPLDYAKLRDNFLGEIKPYRESLVTVGNVLGQLNQAGSNPASAEAARTTFMKAFKFDGNPDKASIERALNTGSLDERVIQSFQGFLQGTLTEDKIKNMRSALATVAKKQQESISKVKENWKKVPVPTDDARDFVTGTADLDSQVSDINGSVPTVKLSPETENLRNKYRTK